MALDKVAIQEAALRLNDLLAEGDVQATIDEVSNARWVVRFYDGDDEEPMAEIIAEDKG